MAPPKQVALVVGASRGIGRQIAIDLAKNGYAVVVAAKSTSDASKTRPFPPDPRSSQSTISTVEREIIEAGGEATAIVVDTRDPDSVKRLVDRTTEIYTEECCERMNDLGKADLEHPQIYKRLDVLIYNSGAIWWASVENSPMKRFQLMQRVNPEGLYATIQAALPHFKKQGWKGRIVVVSPPIYSRFFRGKTAYAMGKVGMSVLTKGLAMDFVREERTDMAVTSIWPAVSIESAATEQVRKTDPSSERDLRKPKIFSDAILEILSAPTSVVNGILALDEDFLREYAGVTDFSKYSVVPGATPRRIMPAKLPDLTVAEQDDEGRRTDSLKLRGSKL